MLWGDERYVRLYKRDTPDWLALTFDAQALFSLLLRKVDLHGRLELGRHGLKAVAVVLNQVALWESRLKPALEELLSDGCVELQADCLLIRNYEAAQEAVASPKLRKRIQRERDTTGTERDPQRTERDPTSRPVTDGHAPSLQPSQPCLPSPPNQPEESSATPAAILNAPPAENTKPGDYAPWPRDVYEKAQRLLGVNDFDPGWIKFIGDCQREKFSVAARTAGVLQLEREGKKPGEAGPGLLREIIRRLAKVQANGGAIPGAAVESTPKWKQQGAASAEEYERWRAEARDAG